VEYRARSHGSLLGCLPSLPREATPRPKRPGYDSFMINRYTRGQCTGLVPVCVCVCVCVSGFIYAMPVCFSFLLGRLNHFYSMSTVL